MRNVPEKCSNQSGSTGDVWGGTRPPLTQWLVHMVKLTRLQAKKVKTS